MAWLSLAALLLFIPSCIGVMAVMDRYRYGRFDYATAQEVPDDGYIELPATARGITLYRHGAGHWARFTIDTPALREWVDERRSLRPDLNHRPVDEQWLEPPSELQPPEMLELKRQIFNNRFRATGWTYEPSMREVSVSRSARGGGYTIWHVPSTGDTFLSAYYW